MRLRCTPVSCVVVVVVVVVPPTLPPSLSTIADAAADAFAIARPRLLQYFTYNFVTQPAARQPNPIATLECAPYKIFFIIFKYSNILSVVFGPTRTSSPTDFDCLILCQ